MKTERSERKIDPEMLPRPPRQIPIFALSMDDASRALSISRPSTYSLIERGVLKTFVVGKRRLTTPAALAAAVAHLEAIEPPLPSDVPNNRRPTTPDA